MPPSSWYKPWLSLTFHNSCAPLAGLTSCTVKPLQMVQNVAVCLVFKRHKRAHVTLLLVNLRWLHIATRIKFMPLTLAYRATSGYAPIYSNSVIRAYAPSQQLCSFKERCLALPCMHARQSQSRLFVLYGSLLVKWTTKRSRGFPLYLVEPLKDFRESLLS